MAKGASAGMFQGFCKGFVEGIFRATMIKYRVTCVQNVESTGDFSSLERAFLRKSAVDITSLNGLCLRQKRRKQRSWPSRCRRRDSLCTFAPELLISMVPQQQALS